MDYFSLCDDPLKYEFDEDTILLQANHFPVETIGDIDVYCNTYFSGSLATYFLDEKKHAYDLFHALAHGKKKKGKKKEVVIYLKELHSYTNISNADIRERLYTTCNILQQMLDENQLNQHVFNYLYIVLDLLERYEKLEQVNKIDTKTEQSTLRVLTKMNQYFSKILFSKTDFDNPMKKS